MAITIAVDTNYQKVTGKTLSAQSLLTSKVKQAFVTVTYGASDTYTTGGNTVDLSLGGRIKTVLGVVFLSNTAGGFITYVPSADNVASTGLFKVWGINEAAAGGAITPLDEIASGSTTLQSKVVNCIVYGY